MVSGVSGTLIVCARRDFGCAVWSPRMDKYGRTVRSVKMA